MHGMNNIRSIGIKLARTSSDHFNKLSFPSGCSTRYHNHWMNNHSRSKHLWAIRCAAKHRHTNLFVRQASSGSRIKIEPFILPDIGEGIKEVVVKEWLVKAGDRVKEFDGLCEVESDKATATISSRYNGVIKAIHYAVGDMAKVGYPLVDIETMSSDPDNALPSAEGKTKAQTETISAFSTNDRPNIGALPSVRRRVAELGLSLAEIPATGKNGRISMDDVEAYYERLSIASSSSMKAQITKQHNKETTKVPLGSITKSMFKTMTKALKIPHFNYADEIDMTRLVEAAKRRKDLHENVQVSNLAVIIKMVSLALQEYPQLNASIDESDEHLIHKHNHNIGVAIDTKAGLIVPNIKNVQNLTIKEVNSELIRLRQLGYDSKLSPSDLASGTLSLSNIGAIGGVLGVPVIMPPEVVIGALGRTRALPRFNSKGEVVARHIMQIVWSADHRVVDGATLSRFSNLIKEFLENPETTALIKLR